MAKLGKGQYPNQHSPEDFKGFGPVVVRDTKWDDSCLCDLGCFRQDEVDSNKYYHLAVVQSTKTSQWYAYFEWGRTKPDGRPNKPAFQFFECSSKEEAQTVCRKQFDSKNTKRGVWQQIGSKERFVGKAGKDVYVVRPTASRLVGLPCVENITNEDAKGQVTEVKKPRKVVKKQQRQVDSQTYKLFRDLLGGAVAYTNAVMTGGKGGKSTLPSKHAIDEGRDVLDDALDRIQKVGDDIKDQLADTELKKLTYHLYGVIPKAKPAGAAEAVWILSKNNIAAWRLDLDAFETALQGQEISLETDDAPDVMHGIPADINWIPPDDSIFKYFVGEWEERKGHSGWWPNATRYRSGTGQNKLRVHNLWAVTRHGDRDVFQASQQKIQEEMPKNWNGDRPMFHDKHRPDLNPAERKLYWQTNTGMLFHGSRSVNIPGIIRENFRFPKELNKTGVHITGAMFGMGTYFADDWSKSAGYCSHPGAIWGGGGAVKGRHSFMFGCDVVLGNPFVAPGPKGYGGPPNGTHCVFGKAGHSGVQNNEWVLFHKGRSELRYLAEISW